MEEKVSIKERIGFSLTNLGNIPIMTLVNSFLLIFYTDVVGLNPADVGTLFLISRIMDAISDPVMGFIIDHGPITKFGKFRPVLITGAVILSANFALLWYGPLMFPSIKLIIVYISYLLLGITFDLMDIPLNSMIPVMSRDDKERNIFTSIKSISYNVGQSLINIVAPLILASASSKKNGFIILVGITTTVILLSTIFGASMIKERNIPKENEKYRPSDLIKVFGCRPVMTIFFTSIAYVVAQSLVNGTALYYVTYVLGNPVYFSVATTCGLIGAVIGGGVAPIISTKAGKKPCYIACLLIWTIGLLLLLIAPMNVLIFYVAYTCFKVGFGGIVALKYSISADNVDYIELHLGVRSEGALAAINSLTSKVGGGIGGAFSGYMLAMIGYIPNHIQSAETIKGLVYLLSLFPAAFLILATIIFSIGYNITKKNLDDMHNDLLIAREEK